MPDASNVLGLLRGVDEQRAHRHEDRTGRRERAHCGGLAAGPTQQATQELTPRAPADDQFEVAPLVSLVLLAAAKNAVHVVPAQEEVASLPVALSGLRPARDPSLEQEETHSQGRGHSEGSCADTREEPRQQIIGRLCTPRTSTAFLRVLAFSSCPMDYKDYGAASVI